MKKISTFAILTFSLLTGFTARAQVGINTTNPDASSALDIVSDSKGVLVPRLTLVQRGNITAPANGLLIYQTDNMPGFYYYNSSAWQPLSGNGGAYVDLTTNQAIGGKKTFDSDINIQALTVGRGGGAVANNSAIGVDALLGNTSGSNNTATGYQTLYSNTTGSYNIAIGNLSLFYNTSGYDNTATGNQALTSNSTGIKNTAFGRAALLQSSTGSSNTGIGNYSLLLSTTGLGNTAVGASSLYTNSIGSYNTAVGLNADVTAGNLTNATAIGYNAKVDASNKVQIGDSNVTAVKLGGTSAVLETSQIKLTGGLPGANKVLTSDATGLATWQTPANASGVDLTTDQTVAGNKTFSSDIKVNGLTIGKGNGTGSGNTAGGAETLLNNTTGFYNTASGTSALNRNTTGYYNTATGAIALSANTTGYSNTANGSSTLASNTTGNYNTASGSYSLFRNTTGIYNTSTGYYSLLENVSGDVNTSTGYSALQYNTIGHRNSAHGSFALRSNTTGSYNTAIGVQALYENTTGSNNTAVGVFADVTAGDLTNATAIGYNAKVNASNKVRIGNSFVTVIEGQVPFTNASDSRFKTKIKPMDKGLEFIMKLKPVSYQMKDSADQRINWGFIAQDIESLVGKENAVLTIGQDSLRSLGLRYTDFISPMVKAMQELAAENTDLKQQLQIYKEKEAAISARLDKLEKITETAQSRKN